MKKITVILLFGLIVFMSCSNDKKEITSLLMTVQDFVDAINSEDYDTFVDHLSPQTI